MRYPIVIHKDKNSDYGVVVPDLPGCYSAGSTMEEALTMAQDAILCHVEGLLLAGEAVPASQPIEKHQKNPEHKGGVWAVVDVDLSQIDDKSERVNITLPRRVLHIIDEAAKRAGETRSGFLARAGIKASRRP